jgi:hypothetical protein
MVDMLAAMREFRFLEDKRSKGGLSPLEEARWRELKVMLHGNVEESDAAPQSAADASLVDPSGWGESGPRTMEAEPPAAPAYTIDPNTGYAQLFDPAQGTSVWAYFGPDGTLYPFPPGFEPQWAADPSYAAYVQQWYASQGYEVPAPPGPAPISGFEAYQTQLTPPPTPQPDVQPSEPVVEPTAFSVPPQPGPQPLPPTATVPAPPLEIEAPLLADDAIVEVPEEAPAPLPAVMAPEAPAPEVAPPPQSTDTSAATGGWSTIEVGRAASTSFGGSGDGIAMEPPAAESPPPAQPVANAESASLAEISLPESTPAAESPEEEAPLVEAVSLEGAAFVEGAPAIESPSPEVAAIVEIVPAAEAPSAQIAAAVEEVEKEAPSQPQEAPALIELSPEDSMATETPAIQLPATRDLLNWDAKAPGQQPPTPSLSVPEQTVEVVPATPQVGDFDVDLEASQPIVVPELPTIELREPDSEEDIPLAEVVEEPEEEKPAPLAAVVPAPSSVPTSIAPPPLRAPERPPSPHQPSAPAQKPSVVVSEASASAIPQTVTVKPVPMKGEFRVVVHTVEGLVKRGTLRDADLSAKELAVEIQPGEPPEALSVGRVKAIFFMLPAGAPRPVQEGRKLRVTFVDGRQVAGFCRSADDAEPGFFMVPSDLRTNTARIYVYRAAIRTIVPG